jgi:hypothetical protein
MTSGLLADASGRFDVQLLGAGLVLHLLADLVRNNGWFTVLRAARPDDVGLRRRDVQAAAFGGRGINALLPARAGDAVKIALLRRRAPDAQIATLAATLIPETLFELCVGLALLTCALSTGYLPVDAVADALAYAAITPGSRWSWRPASSCSRSSRRDGYGGAAATGSSATSPPAS